jgi:hypothetical protein
MSANASSPDPRRKAHLSRSSSRGDRPTPKPDALTRARERGDLSRAEYALERATSLFRLGSVRSEYGDVERPDPHDATMVMRDLALTKDQLTGNDRRRANRTLARPTDGNADPQGDGYDQSAVPVTQCYDADGNTGEEVCFTWVNTTTDAVTPTDTSPANGTPDHIDNAALAMQDVWGTIVQDLGYLKPQNDGNSVNDGGSGKLDIYFADIGDEGLYGYCTTDEPNAKNKQQVSAYCVLDNDYSVLQYDAPPPEVNGLDALQITLAHEFFHASQFAYDWKEAKFLMEGTATWAEDRVFNDINANYAYLFDSALHQPEIPLDAFQKGDDDENFEYGSFVFFTLLAEVYELPANNGVGVDIIRSIWNRAAQAGQKGMEAVRSTISAADLHNGNPYPGPSNPFRDFFADWAGANFAYDAFYNEGWDGSGCDDTLDAYWDALECRNPPFDDVYILEPGDNTKMESLSLDHLSTRYVTMVTPGVTQLKVTLDFPNRSRGGEARLVIYDNAFNLSLLKIKLNKKGNGSKTFNLVGNEAEIELTLVNTGSHNNEPYKYKVEAS